MKIALVKFLAFVISVGFVVGIFQNCGKVQFNSAVNIPTDSSAAASTSAPPTDVVCDPFSSGGVTDNHHGIRGSLHYSQNELASADCVEASGCGSRDYIRLGTRANVALYLGQIFVPTRSFTEGFSTNGVDKLKDATGQDLVEWFALDLSSQISLGAQDPEGLYQFATISDDGVTLTVSDQDILKDEGIHGPQLACASQTVTLKKGDLLPIRLTYFQGPRERITLVLLWRAVNSPNLGDCGASDGTLGDPQNLPASLSDRGWRVVRPENFILNSGVNACSAP